MHSRGPHGASPILSSTWSISHLSAIHTTSNKTRQRILQPSMGLFFLARNTKNIMHIIWAAPPSHYPREKDSHASGTWSHTTSTNTSSPWLSCLKIAMICNWRTASQLVSWPPWLWLPFSACFWHSHSTGWGFFGFFSFLPPLALCLSKFLSSSLPINTKHWWEQAEGGHWALGCFTARSLLRRGHMQTPPAWNGVG